MLYVTLIRHAKSSWDYPDLIDFERPLNKRGLRDAPVMARQLKNIGYKPDRVLTSPSARTLQTLNCFVKEEAIREECIQKYDKLYEANFQELLDTISRQPVECSHLTLVGHNPGLTDLIRVLTGTDIGNLPTSGVATLGADCREWQQVPRADCRLLMLLTPKGLVRKKDKTTDSKGQ